MGRRAKPNKVKAEAKPSVTPESGKGDLRVRDLEKRLAEALRDKSEALAQLQTSNRELAQTLEQQTATSEILHGISSFPSNLQPLMNVVAENAARVCGATDAVVYRLEDGQLQLLASYGDIFDSMVS